MAAFPTIEMVKECLKKACADKRITLPPPLSPEIANKVINLDCNIHPFPVWKQCLDMKTGETYFINKKTRTRIDNKPCNNPGRSYYIWKSNDDHSDNRDNNGKSLGNAFLTLHFLVEAAETTNYLMLVACKECFKNMMVAKETNVCPRCGETIIQFTKERCSE